jgi:hypothetical protein
MLTFSGSWRNILKVATYGFDMLLPVVPHEEAQPWCSIAGVEVAPLGSVNAFTRLTNPLVELQGIDAYWNSKTGRTPEEKRTYQTVLDTLNKARADWGNLGLPDDFREEGLNFIEAGLRGESPLADAAAKLLQGEHTPTMALVATFIQNLTVFDCLTAVFPQDDHLA